MSKNATLEDVEVTTKKFKKKPRRRKIHKEFIDYVRNILVQEPNKLFNNSMKIGNFGHPARKFLFKILHNHRFNIYHLSHVYKNVNVT